VNFAVLFVTATLILQLRHNPEPAPQQINHLCGRLDHADRVKVGDRAYSYSHRKVLGAVELELYKANGNRACCADLERIDVVTSNKRGRFEFRRAAAGFYWVRSEWNGKEFKLPIVFKPEKNFATECSEQGILIDDEGSAEWWLSVTVD
jgi:hypothetical protein